MKAKIITKEDIVEYLEEIQQSIKNDAGTAIDFYMDHFLKTDEGIGLFTIPRIIFPEIDNLGSYYAGTIKNTSANAINFIKDYFSKINLEYLNKGAFIYQVYRHGLMHQHIPKFVSYKNKNLGWAIGLSNRGTKSSHLKLWGKSVKIDGKQFYEDLLIAIDLYKEDIKSGNRKLISNFIKAHKEMITPISKTALLKKSYFSKKDLSFIK
jgi:hypothetical protein